MLLNWRKFVYAAWLISVISIYFNILPFLNQILEKPIIDFLSFQITGFFLITSLSILLITGSVSTKMINWVNICSRSSGLMFITVLIFAAGLLTTIDVIVAVVTGNEPFILSYIFSLFFSRS